MGVLVARMDDGWNSRRSRVFSTRGQVACSQPLAASIGLDVLKKGGNAFDAALATAATMNVTQPCSCGVGGDGFVLFFDAKTKTVRGLNGSGRSPSGLTMEVITQNNITKPTWAHNSPLAVTVPGAVSLWCDGLEKFGSGKLTLKEILLPAIELAESGFPVGPVTSEAWRSEVDLLKLHPNGRKTFLMGEDHDRAPNAGEIFSNPDLASTLRTIAEEGKAGFYQGRIAKTIVSELQKLGGVMTEEDLKNHFATEDDPIHVEYKGTEIYEMPPNGQGLTALLALNVLKNLKPEEYHSAEHLHQLIESLRLGFADSMWYVSDPAKETIPLASLLSEEYGSQRAKLFNPEKCGNFEKGAPENLSNTIYLSVVDQWGNAASFIYSNYERFGTGIVPEGCGFTLQNRGLNFYLNPDHPNCLAPNKRPYHTIIPGMAVKDGELYASFGVMGGFMQPQGHVQVLNSMLEYGMHVQQALDAPRFCISPFEPDSVVNFEPGFDPDVLEKLKQMGHQIRVLSNPERFLFGRGHIIRRNPETGVLEGGSDPRSDGFVY